MGVIGRAPEDTLEVRWIVPGPLGSRERTWFARFPAEAETRLDTYLARPLLDGLSVKLRDGSALDVKFPLGSPGVLAVPGSGQGRLECWRKVSYPCDVAQAPGTPPGWIPVRKARRSTWFPLPAAGHPASRPSAGCTAELTDIRAGGRRWWTVALEATGPGRQRREALEHAAWLLFASPLPPGPGFGLDNTCSYSQWLARLFTPS
jgi:hypothetical protein